MTATPPPAGPDEAKYDLRKGAAAYAPIVGAFGALAVTAIVVVFTVASTPSVAPRLIALSTGLLVIGVFGSLIGAFGLAAIGAENDPTANLSAAVMFIAVPVVISILAILGAFEVLSVIYIDKSSELFVAVAGAGGLFGMVFNAFSIADSPGHHPTSFTATELNNWRNRQWLATRAEAYKAMKLIIVSTGQLWSASLPACVVWGDHIRNGQQLDYRRWDPALSGWHRALSHPLDASRIRQRTGWAPCVEGMGNQHRHWSLHSVDRLRLALTIPRDGLDGVAANYLIALAEARPRVAPHELDAEPRMRSAIVTVSPSSLPLPR